jgi:hypothetical protein
MSIPAKRRRSQSGEIADERQHSESLTAQTSTTATENSALASAELTPLTAMDVSELEQGNAKPPAEIGEEERLGQPQEFSWQGWAELENDPVGSNCHLICPFSKTLNRPSLVSCYANGALKVFKFEKSYHWMQFSTRLRMVYPLLQDCILIWL